METSSEYVSGRTDVLTSTLSIRKLFVGSVASGGLLIFISVFWANAFFSMLFPVLIMAAYIAITFYKDMDLPRTLIGDSYYYLGFIFTLLALTASLLTLGDHEVSIGAVIGSFGAALLTTIIGLIARLMITTFSTESAERSERLEQEIERSLDRFTAQLEVMTSKVITSVVTISSETDAALNETLSLQRETQQQFSEMINSVLSSLESSVSHINKKLTEIEINPDVISSAVTSSFDVVSQKLIQVIEKQTKLNKTLEKSLIYIESFSDNAEHAVTSQISKSSEALSELISQQAAAYNDSLEAISSAMLMSFGDIKDIKSTLEDEWRLRIEGLNSETSDLSKTVQDTNVTLDQMRINISEMTALSAEAKNSFKDDAQKFSKDNSISDIIASLKELAHTTAQSSGIMLEIVEDVRNSQSKMTTSLSSIDETVDEVSNAAKVVNNDLSKVYKELTEQIIKISNHNV